MTAPDPFDLDALAGLADQYRVESTPLAEVLDRLDTALAALEDTQTALADVRLDRGTTQADRDHARLGMGLARRQLEQARREATDALEWLEAVGRYASRRRHPSSRRHG